jgi:AraC-like DNA-binding protein
MMAEVSNVTFHYVLKTLELKTQISMKEMLEEINLDLATLEQKKKIKSYKLAAIFRYCMEKTDNPNLALELGQSISYQSLGILGYLLLNAKDLKEMIEKFSTYQKLVSNFLKFSFFEDTNYYKFAIYINENRYIPVPSFHAEVHLSAILSILTQILGQKVLPAKVCFAYAKQTDSPLYGEIFGQNIHYEEEENAIYFQKDELCIQVNNANPAMLSFFETQANELLNEFTEDSWFAKVEKEILKDIGDKDISINVVASNLNLSARTLQNYLKNESKTFSSALTNVRKKLAKHYIEHSQLDDGTIAFLLGYTEVSSFYRAFKKWYNCTPKQLRHNLILHPLNLHTL